MDQLNPQADPNVLVREAMEIIRSVNVRTLEPSEAHGFASMVRVQDTAQALKELTAMLQQTLSQVGKGLEHWATQDGVFLRPTSESETPLPGDTVLERRQFAEQAVQAAQGAAAGLEFALEQIAHTASTLYSYVPATPDDE